MSLTVDSLARYKRAWITANPLNTVSRPTPTTMSDDLAAIHKQTSAIFEKLYDEKNQPEQLDEAFIQEYFKRVQDALNLDVEEDPLKGPRPTEAMLSHPDSGLIDVLIKSKVEKFVVSALASGK